MKAGLLSIAIVSVGLISFQSGLAQPSQASNKVRTKQQKAAQKQYQETKQAVPGSNTQPIQKQRRNRVRTRLQDRLVDQADDAQQKRFVDGDGDGICDNQQQQQQQQQQRRLRNQRATQRGQYKQRSVSNQASRHRSSSGQSGQGFGEGFVDADGDGICDNYQRRHQNGGQHGHGNTNQH